MLKDKICHGVLAVETDWGVRYIQPSLFERLRLLWTFRNFRVLPEEVLKRHERSLVNSLCRRNGKFLANWNGHGDLSLFCIGTVERSTQRPQPASFGIPPKRAPQPSAVPRGQLKQYS
jgi:hypothetical protein